MGILVVSKFVAALNTAQVSIFVHKTYIGQIRRSGVPGGKGWEPCFAGLWTHHMPSSNMRALLSHRTLANIRFFKNFFKRLILEIQRGEGGEREREKERERGRGNMDFVAPPIHAFTGCSLCVPRLGSEPTALVNQDDALSN